MGTYPELAIFRRFGALNLQNIIYMQADITHLEEQLREMVAEDNHSSDPERKMLSRDWWAIAEGSYGMDEASSRRYKIVMKLRSVLKDYNDALMQQAAVLALQPPAKNDLGFLRYWLNDPLLGNRFLVGPDSATWDEVSLEPDLVALRPRSDNEKRFSKRATDFLILLFHRFFGRRLLGGDRNIEGLVDYSSSNLLLLIQILTAILSSLLLMISVVVLYFVRSAGARLGIIGAFTAFFSLSLAVFSGANRNEIFGATAACIAVQIVFVGTN